jgi:hypothetical protein
MSEKEWHVRPGARGIWEVWGDHRLIYRGSMEAAWEKAKAAAQHARGRAFQHYQNRVAIRLTADFKAIKSGLQGDSSRRRHYA